MLDKYLANIYIKTTIFKFSTKIDFTPKTVYDKLDRKL